MPEPAPTAGERSVLALPVFRRLWIGLGLSSLGDWLGLLALTALAGATADTYAGANYAIASVLFLRVLPALVFGPLAGYIVDHLDRRRTLIWGDYARAALFASIPLLGPAVGMLVWILIITVLVEIVSMVWGPAKDACVPNLVPREQLENANQLSLAATYGSAVPAAAIFAALTTVQRLNGGELLGVGAVEVAVFANALSYLVSGLVIASLTELPREAASAGQVGLIESLGEGWGFVRGSRVVAGLILGMGGAFAAGGAVVGLARTLVSDLDGGEAGYAVLFGAVFAGMGLGLLRGSKWAPSRSRHQIFGAALAGCGLGLVALALVPRLEVVVAVAVVVGACAGTAWVVGMTLLGLETPDEFRGRVFAFVGALIRLVLAVVLAAAPFFAGAVGMVSVGQQTYRGAAIVIALAGVLMSAVGLAAYRLMHHSNLESP